MKPITVLLAEDHAVVREGIRALLRAESDIACVGEAVTGRQAVERVKELRPDVVVMDIGMPLLNGLEATRQIREAVPTTRVLILSAYDIDEYVDRAMNYGAAGYLIKQTPFLVLAAAIRKAHSGGTYFSPSIAARRLHRNKSSVSGASGRTRKVSCRLTSRELEVLQLIAEGKANKQTADELGISIKTVEKHRQNLMSKLDIHDTAGLTRYAIAAGVIEGGVRITME